MKTFNDLIEEVHKPGLCHHCGGCVTFCTAINFGALEVDARGQPRYKNKDKCIECGLCYTICPETEELEKETNERIHWVPPLGPVLDLNVARSKDIGIRHRATDGGVVTALLLRLFARGHIDGAVVSRQDGPFNRTPCLATTPEEVLVSAGFHFETSAGMHHLSEHYSTYSSSIDEFRPIMQRGLRRVAFVGTPCQIKSVRKMETLGIVPSDSIKYHLGLFCSGNFSFSEKERVKLEELGNFRWEELKKINIKEALIIRLQNGETRTIELDKLDFMKRYACRFCPDYSAEYADLSFGGLGAEQGWTTIITRTPLGRAVLADALDENLELFPSENKQALNREIMEKINTHSAQKKQHAELERKMILSS